MERFQQRFLSKRWQKVLLILSGIVVFVTTYALILPAITIDTDTAEREPGIEVSVSEEVLTDENGDPVASDPAEEMPAVFLTESLNGVVVKVEADAGVFPVDTSLVLDAVSSEPLMPTLMGAVEAEVVTADCFAISFVNPDGEPVTPQDSYRVAVFSDALESENDSAVVRLDDTGAQVIEDADFSYKKTSFETDGGASTIALVQTQELTAEYLTASGVAYEVTVSFDATAMIPADATLSLTEFKETDEEYASAKDALEKDADGPVDSMSAFDLSILAPDGAELEPASPVSVSITVKSLPDGLDPVEFGHSLSVQHLKEDENGDITVETMDCLTTALDETVTVSFVTESFSTYTLRTSSRTVTVHYGYMNAQGVFQEFSQSEQPLNMTPSYNNNTSYNNTSSYAHLIYDVEGYSYAFTYRNSNTSSNRIAPLLYYNNSRWRYTTNMDASNSSPSWSNLSSGDNVYVVYEKTPEVAMGGEAKLYEYGANDTPPVPTAEKDSVNNHDGTRTISLSVSGGATPIEVEKLADVIVVFDVSGSMKRYLDSESNAPDNESRLYHTKAAAKALADELLNGAQYFNRDGNHLVRMSLIKFSNVAEQVNTGFEQGNFTENYNTFAAAIDSMGADGGTNWEHALQLANEVNDLDPERATFVIFITDGNPTFRETRYNVTDATINSDNDISRHYYRAYGVFGQGSSDNQNRNFNAALAQAESIIDHRKLFYAIGVSGAVTNLEDLTLQAHTNVGKNGDGHTFSVSNEEDLYSAFDEIRSAIAATLGWTNVDIDDGITEETELSAKMPVVGISTDENFKYYKTKNGVTTEWNPASENCDPAVYNPESGCVEWHMGNQFQLDQGVTYTVKFMVWPSQQALDYITQIQNGVITYDELPDNVKEQIVLDPATGVYTLKTNRDPMTFSYELSKKTGDTVVVDHSLSGEGQITVINSDPLVLETMEMRIDKDWLDQLTDGEDRMDEVTLYLQRRLHNDANGPEDGWENFEVFHRNADGTWETTNRFVFSDSNEWSISFFITPGLVDADGNALDPGYEYRVREPDIDYHYELDGETVRPMFYGNEDNESAEQMALDEDGAVKENLTQKDVYIVENFLGDTDGSHSLSAVNAVKGGINVKKYLYDAAGSEITNDDTVFTIKGYILDPDGNPYTFDPSWDDRSDKSSGNGASDVWRAHQNDPIAFHTYNSAGTRTGYKLHAASTDDITLELKAGESVRFVNVPRNCTYAFWEVTGDLPSGYQWVSITGDNKTRDENNEYISYEPQPYPTNTGATAQGDTYLGGLIYSDVQHNIDIANRVVQPNRIVVTKTVYKSDEATQIWPEQPFTVRGYIIDRYGDGYTFNPALDDREDLSQGIPEAEYGNYTWDDHQDDPIAYNIIDKDGNYVVYKGHFPTTDMFTVQLRGGDTLEFLDVPSLCSYMIWENTSALDDPDSVYEFVSTTVDASSMTGSVVSAPRVQQSFGESCGAGTIHEGEEHDVRFRNKLKRDPVELQLVKTDAEDDTVKVNGAEFALYADSDHTTPATDYEGNEIGAIVTGGYADEEETQPLGTAYIGAVWPGTYYLAETHPPDGYEALSGDVVITVGSDGSVTVTNPDSAAATGGGSVTENNGIITVAIPNTPRGGAVLPSTGGRGTTIYISCGLLLMLTAVLIYIFSLRRRKGVRVNS